MLKVCVYFDMNKQACRKAVECVLIIEIHQNTSLEGGVQDSQPIATEFLMPSARKLAQSRIRRVWKLLEKAFSSTPRCFVCISDVSYLSFC